MVEQIKPHPVYPDYMIGTDGSVFNMTTNRFIGSEKGRYLLASIRGCGTKGIHVLVAETFIEKPESVEALVVNHKDLNRYNNTKSNLEWVTQQENMDHARINGAIPSLVGEDNPTSILTEEQVRCLCKRLELGESTTILSKELGINITTIHQIKSGDNWKHISKDFIINKRIYGKKLSEKDVRCVCEMLSNHERIKDIVKITKISKDQVVKIKSRKNHSKISKDYDW